MRIRFLKKEYSLLAVLVVSAALILGGTFAWFSTTDRVENVFHLLFDTHEPDADIKEPGWQEPEELLPGGTIEKDPYVVNTGDTPVVVRVKVMERWTDPETGNMVFNPLYVQYTKTTGSDDLEASEFMDLDDLWYDNTGAWLPGRVYLREGYGEDLGYFYYDQVLQVGDRTPRLFTGVRVLTLGEIAALITNRGWDGGIPQDQIAGSDLDILLYLEFLPYETEEDRQTVTELWGDDIPQTEWNTQAGGTES